MIFIINKLKNSVKVLFCDKRIRSKFWGYFSIISAVLSFVLLFNIFPCISESYRYHVFIACLMVFAIIYLAIWYRFNFMKKITIDIDGSNVILKAGDLFEEKGLKVIPFNEYFDTKVDNKIISEYSLNGVFINEHLSKSIQELDEFIIENCDSDDIIGKEIERKSGGKEIKYKLSSSVVYEDYILTAFSKFNENNEAILTMPEYMEFLINFWDRINRIYAQRSVSVPIIGSGITRIKEHKNISDEDLLKIMLWTFKLSEYRFKYPAKLTIVIHEEKMDRINLLDVSSIEKGL